MKSDEYHSNGIIGIHLGDYIYWDEERQTEFVIDEYGWKEDEVEGTYKGYKSTECVMPGVHDFACYLKRGFGRTSFHLSSDIRSGILTRDDIDPELLQIERTVPPALAYFSQITGIGQEEFVETVGNHRHASLKGVEIPIIPADGRSFKPLFLSQLKNWLEQSDD